MLNGLNVGGASELVHEISTKEREAFLRYSISVQPRSASRFDASVMPIEAGSIRIARDFRFGISSELVLGKMLLPSECLINGLAGCVLFTWIQGCSAKGIAINELSIAASAEYNRTHIGTGLKNVRYTVHIDTEAATDQVIDVAEKATCFSPTHRSFVEDNDITLDVVNGDSQFRQQGSRNRAKNSSTVSPSRDDHHRRTIETTLDWIYGAQFRIRREMNSHDIMHDMMVDQPKQLNGIDSAPNPQEYLLGGLAAELLEMSGDIDVQDQEIIATAWGAVDLRGFFNVRQDVPVKVHSIGCRIELPSKHPTKTPGVIGHEVLDERCVNRGVVWNTLEQETSIEVEVVRNTEVVAKFASNKDSVKDVLERKITVGGRVW